MQFSRFSLLICLPATFASSTWAQALEDNDAALLPAVVVTANRVETTIASIPGTVQVIDEAQIRSQSGAGRRLADILDQLVPGMAPSSGGMSNFGQTLRGRSVLVLIDGVSQNGIRDTARQLNSISPDSIERIEVLSGANSIYGAGAAGGIINIITKRNQGQELAFTSKLGTTASNRFKGSGFAYEGFQSATGRKGPLDWYVSGAYTQRNDQFDGRGRRIAQDTSQGSNMDTDTYDLQGRFGYQLDDSKRLTLGLQNYRDKQNTAYTKDPNNPDEAVAVRGLRLDDQPATRNRAINLNFTDQDFFGQGLNIESYWRKSEALFFPDVARGLAGIAATDSSTTVYGIRTAIDTALPAIGAATGNLVWGADLSQEVGRQRAHHYAVDGLNYNRTGIVYELGPDLKTSTRALFAQTAWEWGPWTLRGGIRQEWIQSKVQDSIAYGEIVLTGNRAILPGGTLKYDATLYNLGAVYQLNEQQNVFANFSQGFSLPDIQRFLRDVSSDYNIHNLNTQALKVDSYEIGWRGDWYPVQAQVAAYLNTSDVTQFYDAEERALRLISQKERVRGVEGSLNWYVNTRWSLGGSYAWTKGQTQQNGQWIHLPATRISPAKTTLFTTYQQSNYSVRLQALQLANYTAALNDGNGRRTDGYTLFDLIASIELPQGRLEGSIHNLTNRNYQALMMQASGRPPIPNAQGRTFGLAYTLDW